MAIIIGAGTTVGGMFSGQCVISVNWAYNPNVQRIYCLGSWTPDDDKTIRRPTYSLSVTLYSSGATPVYSVLPDTSCTVTNQVAASVDPATCEDSIDAVDFNDWVITGYGYNKDDPQNPSQESWSLQRWHEDLSFSPPIRKPSYIIRGISEGSVNTEVEAESGIVFTGVTETGSQGSVSAGGVGRADDTKSGVVTQIGASNWVYGHTGTGNVTIPYTPLWLS